MKKYLVIFNGTIVTGGHEIRDGVVVIQDHKIIDAGRQGYPEIPSEADRIDAEGNYIIPGMIDIHVNGAMGADVTKLTSDTFRTMGDFFVKHGVTAYLPTAITSPDDVFISVLEHTREFMKQDFRDSAEVLGIHMEGPYLSPEQSGAHPRQYLALPDPSHYSRFLAYDDVLKKMTLAPELSGASQLVRDLKDRGIIAAAGHCNGIYPEMIGAIDQGITHVTHFFCNMSHFRRHHLKRVAGAVETFLYDNRVTAELIADGWHVDSILMKLLVHVKGVDNVCFVTDAMPAAGLPDGRYFIGSTEAIVENGIARLPDHSAYAGSVTTMDKCLETGINSMGLSFQDALCMVTSTPAKIIGVDHRKGGIEKNKDADIVIIDGQANVLKTIVMGKLVYIKPKEICIGSK
ncbi:MAG: N-acetylglucosamine-6-phosphate deacetylase [Prolixibacteraceae bacterium]